MNTYNIKLFQYDWLVELQYLLAKTDGQGIREDIASMTKRELRELYNTLNRAQSG